MDMRGKNQWGDKNPLWKGHLDKKKLIKWYQDGLSLSDIAKKTNLSTTGIFRRFKRYSIPTDPIRRKSAEGNKIVRNGYILVKCKNHPYSNYGGYVREHRLVMEEHLGRYLTKKEVVHHKDDNILNNDICNLRLFKDQGSHLSYHMKRCKEHNKEA